MKRSKNKTYTILTVSVVVGLVIALFGTISQLNNEDITESTVPDETYAAEGQFTFKHPRGWKDIKRSTETEMDYEDSCSGLSPQNGKYDIQFCGPYQKSAEALALDSSTTEVMGMQTAVKSAEIRDITLSNHPGKVVERVMQDGSSEMQIFIENVNAGPLPNFESREIGEEGIINEVKRWFSGIPETKENEDAEAFEQESLTKPGTLAITLRANDRNSYVEGRAVFETLLPTFTILESPSE